MSIYKIENINYSAASSSYDKNSKLIDNLSQRASHIEDKISIGEKGKVDFGPVNTEFNLPKAGILMATDEFVIKKQDKKTNFWDVLQSKFKTITKSEAVSINDIAVETNLVELAAAVNEAEINLQQIVQVRDKLVSAFKEILNSSF